MIKFIDDHDTILEKMKCKACERYLDAKYFAIKTGCIPFYKKECKDCRNKKC